MRLRLLVAAAALVALVSCGRGDDGPAPLVLDGTPRFPQDEGVVTTVSTEELVLDGERGYGISDNVRSFSVITLAPQPLVGLKDQYVQVGLDGDTVVWVGRIAAVIRAKTNDVFYVGQYMRQENGRAVFRDGTTLRLEKDVTIPPSLAKVTARIDPARKTVVEMRPA